MEVLHKYLTLDNVQTARFEALKPLYEDWNSKINVISRKDMDDFYLHHVLHSLSLTKILPFRPGTQVLDLGTGGGFPGIPLAIFFPEVQFTLVDSIGKKIKVVQAVIDALALKNVDARHGRVEEIKKQQFQFVVSRAVTDLSQLLFWTRKLIAKKNTCALPNGLLVYKGGDIKQEILALPKSIHHEVWPIYDIIKEEYFKEKFILYLNS